MLNHNYKCMNFLLKTWRFMKLTVFLTLLGILRLSAGTYTQADSISLDLNNSTCQEALEAIKKQTKLDFFYNNQEINAVGKVSVHCKNVSLEEALKQVLGNNFTFRIVDNMVVIRPQETKSDPVKQRVAKGVVDRRSGVTVAGGDCSVERDDFRYFDGYGWKVYYFFPQHGGFGPSVFIYWNEKPREGGIFGTSRIESCVGRGNDGNGRSGCDGYF